MLIVFGQDAQAAVVTLNRQQAVNDVLFGKASRLYRHGGKKEMTEEKVHVKTTLLEYGR